MNCHPVRTPLRQWNFGLMERSLLLAFLALIAIQLSAQIPASAEPLPKQAAPRGTSGPQHLNLELAGWAKLVQRKVERTWTIPEGIYLDGTETFADISFRVDRNGRVIGDPQVFRHGSDFALGMSGIQAIKAAQPLPPLPQFYSKNEETVIYRFSLTGERAPVEVGERVPIELLLQEPPAAPELEKEPTVANAPVISPETTERFGQQNPMSRPSSTFKDADIYVGIVWSILFIVAAIFMGIFVYRRLQASNLPTRVIANVRKTRNLVTLGLIATSLWVVVHLTEHRPDYKFMLSGILVIGLVTATIVRIIGKPEE